MQSNNLRMAIRATAAATIFGLAGQAGAVSFTAGDYDLAVYGYGRFTATYDIDENAASPFGTRSGSFSGINTTDTDGPTGHFGADAVQSRIGVKATSPEGVTVNIEGDFRPGTLRLRHGYGSYMGVLAGQTWSNFTSFVGNTSTLDFDSLPGVAGYQSRTPQIRYTTGPLSFSLEDPRSSMVTTGLDADTGDFVLDPVTSKNSLPTLTARLEDSAGGMSYSVAALAHQLGYDDGTNDESSLGFATFVAAKMALSDMITIQGSLSYSDGANSYLYRSGNDFGAASAYVAPNGDVETISGFGGTIGTGINLGGGNSVNIGYGMVTVDWDDAEADGVPVAGQSETNSALMANYKWTPVKNVMMGVEYQFLSRENQNGNDGDANRLMFAAQYNF